jgi:hypothetical protein
MQFRLSYRGTLQSTQNRGRLQEIHEIRRIFHPQMQELWTLPPLVEWRDWSLDADDPHNRFRTTTRLSRGAFVFCPLVCPKLHLTARLDILLLRGVAPGRLFKGGDIDNKIKMLLDALRMPSLDEIKSAPLQAQGAEMPLFTLLHDDDLVTGLSVQTDYLLHARDRNEVLLIIEVNLAASRPMAFHEGLV